MRQWILSSLIITGGAGIFLPAQSPPSNRAIFSDEFSGRELDRTKWNVIITGETVNDEQQAYVDSPETITIVRDAQGADGGALAIRTRYKPQFTTPEGRTFDFISGRLDTRSKFDFTYGTAAARVKLTAGAGLWPAFWALGNGNWPDTGEMDILENVGDPPGSTLRSTAPSTPATRGSQDGSTLPPPTTSPAGMSTQCGGRRMRSCSSWTIARSTA